MGEGGEGMAAGRGGGGELKARATVAQRQSQVHPSGEDQGAPGRQRRRDQTRSSSGR